MDKKKLQSDISIVFDKEEDDLKYVERTWTLLENSGNEKIDYPHTDTLIDIFSNIQNKEVLKSEFIRFLKEKISISSERRIIEGNNKHYVGCQAVCFYTLIQLGFIDDAINAFEKRIHTSNMIVYLIESLMNENRSYFDMAQLNKLLEKIEHCSLNDGFLRLRVVRLIVANRYTFLKREIKGVNLEINQDRKTVSEKITYLTFDEKYNDLLNEIDKHINTQSSNVINAGMISNLRVFLQDLFTDIAKRISKANNETIPKIKGCKEMGNIRYYLKDRLDLSDKDHKFINSFIEILHTEGGHSFTSNREYFRLARNIAIELALLILSKYEKQLK